MCVPIRFLKQSKSLINLVIPELADTLKILKINNPNNIANIIFYG